MPLLTSKSCLRVFRSFAVAVSSAVGTLAFVVLVGFAFVTVFGHYALVPLLITIFVYVYGSEWLRRRIANKRCRLKDSEILP